MSSEPEVASLHIVTSDPFVQVAIFDGQLRAVALDEQNAGTFTRANLPLGMYKIEFRAGDASEATYAALSEAGATVTVQQPERLRFTSAAPVADTRAAAPMMQAAAETLSRRAPMAQTGYVSGLESFGLDAKDASLMLFVQPARDVPAELLAQVGYGIELVDRSGVTIATCADGEHGAEGWTGFNVEVAPGTYRLRLTSGKVVHEQALVVAKDFQTQAFLRVVPLRTRGTIELRPDGASLSLFMAKSERGFAPNHDDVRMSEMALQALASNQRLRGIQRNALLNREHEDPMAGLYGGHLLISGDGERVDRDLARQVIDAAYKSLGPIPDVVALRLGMMVKLGSDPFITEAWPEIRPLRELPMLYKSWKRWVQASQRDPALIPPGSLGDRVAGYAGAIGPWLGWSTRALDGLLAQDDPIERQVRQLVKNDAEQSYQAPTARWTVRDVAAQLRVPPSSVVRAAAKAGVDL